jgi:hypothetical protein
MRNDKAKMRGVICKLSLDQQRKMEDHSLKNRKKTAKLRQLGIERGLKKERKKRILEVMERESRHWFYPENADEALRTSVLIPNNMQQQTDYYVKLQEKAIMVHLGKYDEIEESKLDHRVMQYKNSKLIPLYANITGMLTRLRDNDIERIYEEYELAVTGLKNAGLTLEEYTQKEEELGRFYELLIMKLKKDMNHKSVKIKLLKEKMHLIFNVLNLWKQYTKMLNLPYEDVVSEMHLEAER